MATKILYKNQPGVIHGIKIQSLCGMKIARKSQKNSTKVWIMNSTLPTQFFCLVEVIFAAYIYIQISADL